MRIASTLWILLSLFCCGIGARADEVTRWNSLMMNCLRKDSSAPPLATRSMALTQLAVFDTVNSIHPKYRPYRFFIAGYQDASADAAAAAAAHGVLRELFKKQTETLDKEYQSSLESLAHNVGTEAGRELGEKIASLYLKSRETDNLETTSTDNYPEIEGRWIPTPPDYLKPLQPGWGSLQPFAIKSGSAFRQSGPPALSSSCYPASLDEGRRLGANDSAARTEEQSLIARFWADGAGTATPPGHWNQIALLLSERAGLSVIENARLFALLNVALADSCIAAWDMKFHFVFWRPVTAIRKAGAADWEPFLKTPPFPDYVSGHSTFSGAAATLLGLFFGGDEQNVDVQSEAIPGSVRHFSSLQKAAEEAGFSRILGGIHFSFANEDGLKAGRQIGRYVYLSMFDPL